MNYQFTLLGKIRTALAAATVICGISSGSANVSACSLAPGFKLATNLEQVGLASTIIVGKVVRWNAKWDKTHKYFEDSTIQVNPVLALKGKGPEKNFSLFGAAMTDKELYGRARPSHQDEFELPHVDASGGGCIRRNFVLGQFVLFMLVKQDGLWDAIPMAYSRWAEDVRTLDAPWVKLVRIYVRANTLPKKQRKSYLLSERKRLLSGRPNRISRLMAEDINRQITRKHTGRNNPDEDYLPRN